VTQEIRQGRTTRPEILRDLVQPPINLDGESHRDRHLGDGRPRSNNVLIAPLLDNLE
jgi:hypothetical protein